MQSTITFQGENIESITKTMMQVYLASLKWNILQCLKQPITHAALAINSVIDSETQFTVRKGRLFFSTQHKLCSNSILKSVDIELQIGDIWRKLPAPRTTLVIWRDIIHPVAPREMVVGADPQPRALGTLFPVYSGIRQSIYTLGALRHSTGEFRMHILYGVLRTIYIEHGLGRTGEIEL